MTPIPKPTLQQAIDGISDRDEYKVIVSFIREEREKFFGDLRSAESSNDVTLSVAINQIKIYG